MSVPPPPTATFTASHAQGYDAQLEPIRPFKDALNLLIRGAFAHLRPDARILVAGAGTGAEVRFLAPLFPRWRFTLVDPSAAMLDVARDQAEAGGFSDRCTFQGGFVSELSLDRHDAATSVLVSHFLVDRAHRTAYFRDIATRLVPGGILFNADLAADLAHPSFAHLMDLWLTLYVAPDRQAMYREMFGQGVAAHSPAEVEEMMASAGFSGIAACYQATLIRGWVATAGNVTGAP